MSLFNESDQKMNGVAREKKAGPKAIPNHARLATISVVYLLSLLAFFFWTLFDIWIRQDSIANLIGYDIQDPEAAVYRLVALTILGGGMGGIINGLRSFLQHGQVFDGRFIWKYITLPWMGATNALFVFALINSGLAVFGSNGETAGTGSGQIVAMFSIGVLAGYGSRDVFLWLDAQVTKLFNYEVIVPNLRNQSVEQAEKKLRQARLELGLVIEEARDDVLAGGKIIKQKPEAGSLIERGSAVGITLAVLPPRTAPSLLVDTSDQLLTGGVTPANGQMTPQLDNIVQPAAAG